MKKLGKLRLNHLAYYVRGARSRVLVYILCVVIVIRHEVCLSWTSYLNSIAQQYACDVCETFRTLIVIRWQCKVLHYNGLDWRGPSFVWLFFFFAFFASISNSVCAIVRIGHQLIILMPTLCAYCMQVANTQVSFAVRIFYAGMMEFGVYSHTIMVAGHIRVNRYGIMRWAAYQIRSVIYKMSDIIYFV